MRKFIITAGAASALALAVAGPPRRPSLSTRHGKGFVGKGDVQSAFSAREQRRDSGRVNRYKQAFTFTSTQVRYAGALFRPPVRRAPQAAAERRAVDVAQSMPQSVTAALTQDVYAANTTNGRTHKMHREGDRSGGRIGEQIGDG